MDGVGNDGGGGGGGLDKPSMARTLFQKPVIRDFAFYIADKHK